jgi:hypothetical protein
VSVRVYEALLKLNSHHSPWAPSLRAGGVIATCENCLDTIVWGSSAPERPATWRDAHDSDTCAAGGR